MSSYVYRNIAAENIVLDHFKEIKIKDYYGLKSILHGIDFEIAGYDIVYTLIGPLYSILNPGVNLSGFAHPWIIYGNNILYRKMGILERMRSKLESFVKTLFLSRAHYLVAEHGHVKNSMQRIFFFRSKEIFVVHSQVDTIFSAKDKWLALDLVPSSKNFRLGVISRNYPHKNLQILPDVKLILRKKYDVDVDFYVTLSRDEWLSQSKLFRDSLINVGPLLLAQCPTFYALMNGIILPTFLECFSAVPIEAMFMRKPIFISDLDFIRPICGDHCYYFDPEDAEAIADLINGYLEHDQTGDLIKLKNIEKNYKHVINNYTGSMRGDSYLKIINEIYRKDCNVEN